MSPRKPLGLERSPAFTYHQPTSRIPFRKPPRVLRAEEVSLAALAEKYGTPLYVYSATAIQQRLATFDAAFSTIPHTVCYAVKANSNLSLLRMMAKLGCGFDIVSGGELERVLRAHKKAAKKVVFSGVGKTVEEMKFALDSGILLFNVESESELWALATCAARMKKTARIALRVNPEVAAETHPYISTGMREHKFGIPMSDARVLYSRAAGIKGIEIAGVSVHIGSQITDPEPFRLAMSRVTDLVNYLQAEGHTIRFVDAGGGLGISYEDTPSSDPTEFAKYVQSYAERVLQPLRGLGVHLLLEPGRVLVGPAGALVTRVLYRKQHDGKLFLIVDAAMNDLIRPALYKAHHAITPVTLADDVPSEVADVVGPVCETGDFLARDRSLPKCEEASLLAILDAGAYGMAQSGNYNTRPRPAEVMVEGKKAKLVRKRETMDDLMGLEE